MIIILALLIIVFQYYSFKIVKNLNSQQDMGLRMLLALALQIFSLICIIEILSLL